MVNIDETYLIIINFISIDLEIDQVYITALINIIFIFPVLIYIKIRKNVKTGLKYLSLLGYNYLIKEQLWLEKIRSLFLLITIIILVIGFSISPDNEELINPDLRKIIYAVIASSLIVFWQCFVILNIQNQRQDFKLFYSQQCFIFALDQQDIIKKRYWLKYGINAYNNYLKISIDRQFKNTEEIYLALVLLNTIQQNKITKEIIDSMLEFQEYATLEIYTKLFNIKNSSCILESNTLIERLKKHINVYYLPIIISSIIPIIGIVIQYFN